MHTHIFVPRVCDGSTSTQLTWDSYLIERKSCSWEETLRNLQWLVTKLLFIRVMLFIHASQHQSPEKKNKVGRCQPAILKKLGWTLATKLHLKVDAGWFADKERLLCHQPSQEAFFLSPLGGRPFGLSGPMLLLQFGISGTDVKKPEDIQV